MNEIEMQVEGMKAAGIDDSEIIRLAGLRRRVAVGDCSEVTDEHKRMVFTRYLIETGGLSDNLPDSEQQLDFPQIKPTFHPNF